MTPNPLTAIAVRVTAELHRATNVATDEIRALDQQARALIDRLEAGERRPQPNGDVT